MKKIIEVNKSTLDNMLGEIVTFFCANYIYTGKLMEVNSTYLMLSDASIVYETGAFDNKQWQDAQKLPCDWCVMINAVESFGILK